MEPWKCYRPIDNDKVELNIIRRPGGWKGLALEFFFRSYKTIMKIMLWSVEIELQLHYYDPAWRDEDVEGD